jgi:hypothetical protein
MLGRRLLLLVAVLLATGAIAAALTPRELRTTDRKTTATTPPVVAPGASGGTGAAAREITRSVDVEGREPAVVRARVGDLIRLSVKAASPDVVELVGTGRFEAVDAATPARFEFFAERPGSYPIHLQEADRDVGRLLVERAEPL